VELDWGGFGMMATNGRVECRLLKDEVISDI
jgi:hypothetical protein